VLQWAVEELISYAYNIKGCHGRNEVCPWRVETSGGTGNMFGLYESQENTDELSGRWRLDWSLTVKKDIVHLKMAAA
jgi:hypothetical protein